MNKIGIIGLGNMGSVIAKGIVKEYGSNSLMVAGPHLDSNHPVIKDHKLRFSTDNKQILNYADVIILAVKPHVLQEMLPTIATNTKLVISVVSGVKTEQISKSFKCPVIRAMPNTPCLIGQGVTALYGERSELAENIFGRMGYTVWLKDEDKLDIATAICGSGPAFVFHYLECLIKTAVELGLDERCAEKLVLETNLGALALAKQSPDLSALKKQITSKGGTTQAGLAILEQHLSGIVSQTINAAYQRAKELGS